MPTPGGDQVSLRSSLEQPVKTCNESSERAIEITPISHTKPKDPESRFEDDGDDGSFVQMLSAFHDGRTKFLGLVRGFPVFSSFYVEVFTALLEIVTVYHDCEKYLQPIHYRLLQLQKHDQTSRELPRILEGLYKRHEKELRGFHCCLSSLDVDFKKWLLRTSQYPYDPAALHKYEHEVKSFHHRLLNLFEHSESRKAFKSREVIDDEHEFGPQDDLEALPRVFLDIDKERRRPSKALETLARIHSEQEKSLQKFHDRALDAYRAKHGSVFIYGKSNRALKDFERHTWAWLKDLERYYDEKKFTSLHRRLLEFCQQAEAGNLDPLQAKLIDKDPESTDVLGRGHPDQKRLAQDSGESPACDPQDILGLSKGDGVRQEASIDSIQVPDIVRPRFLIPRYNRGMKTAPLRRDTKQDFSIHDWDSRPASSARSTQNMKAANASFNFLLSMPSEEEVQSAPQNGGGLEVSLQDLHVKPASDARPIQGLEPSNAPLDALPAATPDEKVRPSPDEGSQGQESVQPSNIKPISPPLSTNGSKPDTDISLDPPPPVVPEEDMQPSPKPGGEEAHLDSTAPNHAGLPSLSSTFSQTARSYLPSALENAHTPFSARIASCIRNLPDLLRFREPEVQPGNVRVRWTCICGERLYDDFRELRPGAARELARRLDRSDRSQAQLRAYLKRSRDLFGLVTIAQGGLHGWMAIYLHHPLWEVALLVTWFATLLAEMAFVEMSSTLAGEWSSAAIGPSRSRFFPVTAVLRGYFRRLVVDRICMVSGVELVSYDSSLCSLSSTGGADISTISAGERSSSASGSSQNPTQQSGTAGGALEAQKNGGHVPSQAVNQETFFLLTCIRIGRYATSLVQLDLKQPAPIVSDRQLLELLRTRYSQIRHSWRRTLLSFQTLTSLEFVQFELHRKSLVDIRKRNDIPPADRRDEYHYHPLPAELIPPVGKNFLMHIYHHPEDAEQETVCLTRFPKRMKERLKLGEAEMPVGWGIEFVEGIHWNKVWCFGFAIVVVSFIVGVGWSWWKRDVQGGFGIAGYMMAFLTFMVGMVQAVNA